MVANRVMSCFLVLLVAPVSARSDGNFKGCSVYGQTWGCKRFAQFFQANRNVPGPCCAGFGGASDGPKNIPENKCARRCCDAKPGIMFWTKAPVPDHNRYALRSANGDPAKDPKVYHPGRLQHIYIKTLRRDSKFRGLLMNAVATDHSNKVVGQWEFPAGETKPLFWSSPQCPHSAVHRVAEEKPFTSLLRWRAPTDVDGKPVGKIVFQALIKRGGANNGEFYTKELTLAQAVAPRPPSSLRPADVDTAVIWSKGQPGQTCNETCASRGKVCWPEAMQSVRGPNSFAAITNNVVCGLPILVNRDPTEAALLASDTGRCFYPSDTVPTACNTARPKSTLLCPCGSAMGYQKMHPSGRGANAGRSQSIPDKCATATTIADTDVTDTDVTESDAAVTHSVLNTLFGALLLATTSNRGYGGSQAAVVVASLIVWASRLGGAEAHNWHVSESRARNKAVGAKPCPPRVGERFNVQVGPDQEFTAAWATGHGENATVLLVSAEHLHLVGSDAVNIARKYINAAPKQQTEAKWRRQHGSQYNPAKSRESKKALTLVVKDDPLHHISPAVLRDNPDTHIFNIDPSRLKKDIRVSYQNTQMPHIYMAGFFVLTERNAFEFDQIRVTLPAWAEPGHYILIWDWQGYADCVDIELRTQKVEHPGGRGSGNHIFERVDHCQLAKPFQAMRGVCRQVAPSVEQCLKDVVESESSVTFASSSFFTWDVMRIGVNVVPILAGSRTNPKFTAADGSTADAPWGSSWNLDTSRAGTCQHNHCRRDAEVCMVGGPLDLAGTTASSWKAGWEQQWQKRKTDQPGMGCKSPPASGSCEQEKGVDYAGGDIANEPAATVGECCDACSHRTDCDVWTYHINGKRCYMKSKALGPRTRRGVDQFISGRKRPISFTLYEGETSLERAVQRCASAECNGIALKDGKYSGCTATSADAASTFMGKTAAYRPDKSDLDTVKASSFRHVVTVSFQAGAAGVVLPANTVADTGGMYSPKSGHTYGWTTCAHSSFDTDRVGGAATVDNTYAWKTWVMCPTTAADAATCQQHVINGVALDPRRPNCKRNAWEMALPNGWYKVVAKVTKNHPSVFSPIGALHNACVIEGTRLPAKLVRGTGHAYTVWVGVLDGRLTFEDVSRLKHEDFCDSLSALEIYQQVGPSPRLADTWFPKSTNPYVERIFEGRRKISIVSMLAPEQDCPHSWLFKGGDANCLQSQAKIGGWFANTGPIVGVSDTSCSNGGCLKDAQICGRVSLARDIAHHVVKFRYEEQRDAGLQSRYWVDCEGKVGKYVFVMLPGSGRILSITDLKVNQEGPVGGDPGEFEDKFVCYLVQARKAEAQTPEYITTTDPEDPIFYSTCYMREEELVYLPKEGSAVTKVKSDYEFNGQCLPCDLHATNSKPKHLVPSIWRFSDECEICDATPSC